MAWWFISLTPMSTLALDLVKGAQLGQKCRVIVCNQFRCIPKLHGEDPRSLLVGTSILSPVDKVQQLAVTMLLVDLGVKDLGDLKLWLTIYKDGQRRRLYSARDRVWGCGFQHRDMEHWVDGAEVVQ